MLSAALRIAAKVWQRHYYVPEWLYWVALLASAAAAAAALSTRFYMDLFEGEPFDRPFVGGITLALLNALVLAVAFVGILRWRSDRRKARGGLVVPRFYEFAGAKQRGEDVRLAVLDALHQNLPESERARVHGIKVTLDLQHRALAIRLLRALRAEGLLHGRVVDRKDGGWTVHARLAQPALAGITHFDWHTSDSTPGRMPWHAWFSKLPSSFDVTDEEFPLELTRDLEAMVRGTAGAVGLAETPAEAEALLREALAVSPDSRSPAMDLVRSQLAFVVFVQDGREDEALDLLRKRLAEGEVFGELRRWFAFLAGLRRDQLLEGLDPEVSDDDDDDEHMESADAEEESWTPEQRELLRRAEELEEQASELYSQALGEDAEDFAVWERTQRERAACLREEVISNLAVAADDETDPRREMSLYNLVTASLSAAIELEPTERNQSVEFRQRAWRELDRLRRRSPYYRKAWYVKRLCGLRSWLEFEAVFASGDWPSSDGRNAAREAAKWYSRAIRARPRTAIVRYVGFPFWRRYRLRSRRSPILDSNAVDAHRYAGHPIRAIYYEARFRGAPALAVGEVNAA